MVTRSTTATNAAFAYSFNTGTLVTRSTTATNAAFAYSFNTGTLVTRSTTATNAAFAYSFNTATLVATAVNIASTATTSTLGGVKIGSGIAAAGDGTIFLDADTQRKLQETYSVKDAGATGDGVTNDATAFQDAIDTVFAAGGGTVYVPDGTYIINSTLEMKSNVTVSCHPAAVVDFNGVTAGSAAVVFTGTASAEYPFTVAKTVGDIDITVSGSPSFAPGDLVHFVSVRNSLSRTDAGSWWLGDGTISLNYAYYGEFNFIRSDNGGGSYTLAKAFIFPGYNVNASGETETLRTTSAAQKITPCENAHWIGGTLKRDITGASFIVGTWAYSCTVRDCTILRGQKSGTSLTWTASFQCEGRNIVNRNDPTIVWNYSTMHPNYNRFKTIGSHDCGFVRLNESYGGQSVDFTYGGSLLFCNARSYCRDSVFSNCFEGITSHPGCYQEQFKDNRVLDCWDEGILVRGYEPEVTGNLVTSIRQETTVPALARSGVSLAYGATRRATVKNNTVRGFSYAFSIIGSPSESLDAGWENCLVSITNNEVSECFTGLYSSLSSASTNSFLRFIQYNDNVHSAMGRHVVWLNSYNAGVTITNNVLHGGFRYSEASGYVAYVYADANCPALIVKDNVWLRTKGSNSEFTKYFVTVGSITDTTTYPEADWSATTNISNNYATFPDDTNFIMVSIGSEGTPYYQSINNYDGSYTSTTSTGVIKVIPSPSRIYTAIVNSGVSGGNLDIIDPATNCVLQEGDILYLRNSGASRPTVLRDIATSGAAANGIQTPGGASFTVTSVASVVSLMYMGSYWSVVSNTLS